MGFVESKKDSLIIFSPVNADGVRDWRIHFSYFIMVMIKNRTYIWLKIPLTWVVPAQGGEVLHTAGVLYIAVGGGGS